MSLIRIIEQTTNLQGHHSRIAGDSNPPESGIPITYYIEKSGKNNRGLGNQIWMQTLRERPKWKNIQDDVHGGLYTIMGTISRQCPSSLPTHN